MSDLVKIAEALQAAGHEDAGRLVRTLADQQQQTPAPSVADAVARASRPAPVVGRAAGDDGADAQFAQQIKAAQERGGGWTSVPLGPSDDGGRF